MLPTAGAVELAPFARVICPWRYAWPIDAGVHAFKFRGERAWAGAFGALLARARLALPDALPELIVPVPLHPARQRARGFNQSADLARCLARTLHRPCAPGALERSRATDAQSRLPAGVRAANVAGAFRATRPLAGLRIALIDDVVTTGSTAAAAAAALIGAGAGGLELWAVARAARFIAPASQAPECVARPQRRTAYSRISPPSTISPK
ncbi:MAG: ComF family protein [Gammaproteobacteria bacterium]|nr:ComF family protein [Gammaproteobacteria bacterium]